MIQHREDPTRGSKQKPDDEKRSPDDDDDYDETPEERYESLTRILQDAGVPGTLWKIIGIFADHPEVPFVCVPLLSKLSVEILIRMMEMQLDSYLAKNPAPTKAFVIGLRCLSSMAVDEALRYDIINADGRELVDYTMTSTWAPHCRLELEGGRRRLLVESLRVARLDPRDGTSSLLDGNIEDKFTMEQLDDLRIAFNTFDTDQSGDIDISELGGVMKKLGIEATHGELQDMIRSAERNAHEQSASGLRPASSDGKIDWREFLTMMSRSMTTRDA